MKEKCVIIRSYVSIIAKTVTILLFLPSKKDVFLLSKEMGSPRGEI